MNGGAARAGVVYLVGAGPGDPGLMTARSLRADRDRRRHPPRPPDPAGRPRRRPRRRRAPLRRQAAGRGRGRAGRDRATCWSTGRAAAPASSGSRAAIRSSSAAAARRPRPWSRPEVPFEVVPGVTAGIAAPAYAGIPVTHRDDASAVAFVTGHEDPEKAESAIDWEALARFPGTLVIYMGVKRLEAIVAELIDAGRDPARAGGGGRARHLAHASAPSPHRSPSCRGSVLETGIGPPAIAIVGQGRRAARCDRLARAPPALRPPRRRHPRPRAGERDGRRRSPGSAPRWSSCPRSGSSPGSARRR